tara:strand:+ start:1135 stop:1350 length:216 start_codon:yes stop_codon:yes gene_type:complete
MLRRPIIWNGATMAQIVCAILIFSLGEYIRWRAIFAMAQQRRKCAYVFTHGRIRENDFLRKKGGSFWDIGT